MSAMNSEHEEHSSYDGLCCCPPSPAVRDSMQQQLAALRGDSQSALRQLIQIKFPVRFGMNDGVIYPSHVIGSDGPQGVMRSPNPQRAPTGVLRVIVVLVNFTDKKIERPAEHYKELFFGGPGSVKEYYTEVTHGRVTIAGDVAGPFTLPRRMAYYANGQSGTSSRAPNAGTMARDTAIAATGSIDFSIYDNDQDGFVDAFIIVHAGRGAEETGNANDIWSLKWVLAGGEFQTDNTKLFAFLTVPEDAKLGVCAHELGHLLFGFPDLYDIDSSTRGVGDWCLMGGGSWNGDGDTPAHPSAWCKVQQGWVDVEDARDGQVSLAEVKDSRKVIRVWASGRPGPEYFLLENRQRKLYDAALPAQGLLIWHVDDSVPENSDDNHPRVKLMQADGRDDLRFTPRNDGDPGDPYPGTSGNRLFNATSNPSSKPYGGGRYGASVRVLKPGGDTIDLDLGVTNPAVRAKPKSDATNGDQVPLARL